MCSEFAHAAHVGHDAGVSFHKAPETEVAVFMADGSFALDVRVEADSVWLSQKQMAELFGVDLRTINEHLINVYQAEELQEDGTLRNFRIVQAEGKRSVTRDTKHYNLDAILSVGYRVNSKRGTQFRIWANGVLREHLLKGYSLNAARLQSRGITELQSAIDLLASTLTAQNLVTDEGRALLNVIQGYARTWNLLLAYDEDTLPAPASSHTKPKSLSVADARNAVSALKLELLQKGEATDLFGLERSEQFSAIIAGLEQDVFGTVLYPTVESRGAHLLYFVIKDHPFSDGNKRAGSFLFVRYLAAHNMHRRISDATLVALALMTAQSDPKQKDLIIRLIMHLIA